MSALELLICAILVGLSAFMSASEVALFSLSRFQLRSFKESFRSTHRRIKKLLGDPSGLLISILVANEVINISLSSLVAEAVSASWGAWAYAYLPSWPKWGVDLLLGILITFPVVLLLCELTPKVIGARANQTVAHFSAAPLNVLHAVMTPFRVVLARLIHLIGGRPLHGAEEQVLLREKEFLFMVEEGHKEGAIRQTELELIQNVFELDDTVVRDVYTPLSQVYSLPSETGVEEALAAMRTRRFSRIPITGSNRRAIVGVLYSKDLLFTRLGGPEVRRIDELMRKPLTVSPSTKLNSLFRLMKRQQTHLAVVESQPGEAIGVVTMDDLLEAIFEDIFPDPEDDEEGES